MSLPEASCHALLHLPSGKPVGGSEFVGELGVGVARGQVSGVDVPLVGVSTTLLVGAGLGGAVVREVVDVASHHESGDEHLLAGLVARIDGVASLELEGGLELSHGSVVLLDGVVVLLDSGAVLGLGGLILSTLLVPLVAELITVLGCGLV